MLKCGWDTRKISNAKRGKKMHKVTFLFLVFSLLTCSLSWAATTYYVDAARPDDTGDGLSWATAKKTVGAAITAAANGDIIELAGGTFGGFTLNKRLTIIGAGKSGGTTINSAVTLNAPVDGVARMVLKNLAISIASGYAITISGSKATLENISAQCTSGGAINIGATISDLVIESCNLDNCAGSGLVIGATIGLDGLVMQNTTVNNNGSHGISVGQQDAANPPELKNVKIKNCAFINTGGTVNKGMYFEKLKDALIENVTFQMPSGNTDNVVDVNLKFRTDYQNITIKNCRITRPTAGPGIYIKGRNDAPNYNMNPASVTNVNIIGCVFTGCSTNIIMENNAYNMTVEKCDLRAANHAATGYGIANYTQNGGVITANNNYWGGNAPVTSVGAYFSWLNASKQLNLLAPSTNRINIGDFVYAAAGIPLGAQVTAVNPGNVQISLNTTAVGAGAMVAFCPAFPPVNDIAKGTALNDVVAATYLANPISDSANNSYASLGAAITGAPAGGAIYNVPAGAIAGTTTIDKNLTLYTAGAGRLDASSLTTFENLNITGGNLTLGADYAVSGIFSNANQAVLNDYMLTLSGTASGSGTLKGGAGSFLTIGGGGGGACGALKFASGFERLFDLTINRTGASPSVDFSSNLMVDYLTLTSGIVNMGANTLTLRNDRVAGGSSASYVTGKLALLAGNAAKPNLIFPIGTASGYFPATLTQSDQSTTTTYAGEVKDRYAPNYANVGAGLSCVSHTRHWNIAPSTYPAGASAITLAYGSEALGAESDRRIAQYQSNWTNLGPATGTASPMTSNVAVDGRLGYFAIASTSEPILPATIYVNDATGNDSNLGTSELSPKKTIQGGADAVRPEGTVTVAAGTYTGAVVNKTMSIAGSGILDCAIKGGGGGSGLTINDTGVSVSGFAIRDFNYGIDVSAGGSATISNCFIFNNSIQGLQNQNTAATIIAENCWWGDNSGPAPTGSGNGVSGSADYDPWIGKTGETNGAKAFGAGGTGIVNAGTPEVEVAVMSNTSPSDALIWIEQLDGNFPQGYVGFAGSPTPNVIKRRLIVRSNIANGSFVATLKIFYTDPEIAALGISEAWLSIQRWDAGDGRWKHAGLSYQGDMLPTTTAGHWGTYAAGNYTWVNVSSFSEFAAGQDPTVPVELSVFRVE